MNHAATMVLISHFISTDTKSTSARLFGWISIDISSQSTTNVNTVPATGSATFSAILLMSVHMVPPCQDSGEVESSVLMVATFSFMSASMLSRFIYASS